MERMSVWAVLLVGCSGGGAGALDAGRAPSDAPSTGETEALDAGVLDVQPERVEAGTCCVGSGGTATCAAPAQWLCGPIEASAFSPEACGKCAAGDFCMPNGMGAAFGGTVESCP
jgi:hypothetical protein